ncbi:MAG: hypothetical protein AAF685_16005 [Cyanobacteria bacterium P01_C01_bin.89]
MKGVLLWQSVVLQMAAIAYRSGLDGYCIDFVQVLANDSVTVAT